MGKSYRDLFVWQKAMELAKAVYEATRPFPKEEMYGLTAQIRRAAVSIPSNIAEGQGRLSKKEFRQFLGIARGSLMEVETQIILARDMNYLSEGKAEKLLLRASEVGRMLNGLINSLTK